MDSVKSVSADLLKMPMQEFLSVDRLKALGASKQLITLTRNKFICWDVTVEEFLRKMDWFAKRLLGPPRELPGLGKKSSDLVREAIKQAGLPFDLY